MKMEELKQKLDCDPWDLWDSVCNSLPYSASYEEIAKTFSKIYNVGVEETKEYFMMEEYDNYLI